MMSKSTQTTLNECTNKCCSEAHGDSLTAAITKRSVHDEQLCAYLSYTCCRCESVRDSQGRTTLHMAASCGRNTLVKWLVESRYANINSKDVESGYTPLHRSIFYGKLDTAIELIKLGANLGIQDSDGLNFLEHSMIDGQGHSNDDTGGEIYTWGTNSNNSLGPQASRIVPELLDVFHKKYSNESAEQVCLSRFHSVILTTSGKCFSCGHGQGGRLGLGIEYAEVTPKQINFPKFQSSESVIIQCSISRDHSLFLTSDGNIYSCGLNVYKVLGILPPPSKLLVPRQTKNVPIKISGICANIYHSLAWGPTGLYTWGLNAGQIGHQLHNKTDDKCIISPKLVKYFNYSDNKLRLVCSSNAVIAVYTEKGDLYVLHDYQCKKIASKQLNIVQISAVGGRLNLSVDPDLTADQNKELKVAALTNTGNLFIWQESDPSLLRCIFSINRALTIRQMTLNDKEVLFITNNGEAFSGSFKPRRKKTGVEEESNSTKSTFHKFVEKELCVYVKLHKFPRIHRALNIQSDPRGENISVIQAFPYRPRNFPSTTQSEMTEDMLNLLEDDATFGEIQDVSFTVENRTFSAHRYIVASASPYLEKLMSRHGQQNSVTLDGVNPDIFEQLLIYIYSKHSDLIVCGPLLNSKLLQSVGNMNENDIISEVNAESKKSKHLQNPVRMLHELSKRVEVSDLQKILNNLELQNNIIKPKTDVRVKVPVPRFNRLKFPELHDVKIICKDKKEIKAHKCILAARMEYFSSMFSMRWSGDELSEVTLPFPEAVVMSLLEYLYTDSLSTLDNKEIDHLFKVLVLADQFLVNRLKEECEIQLTDLITLKNCAQMYSLAHAYNAVNLKYWCIRFILSNLTAILELRILEDLDSSLVQELSRVYFEESPHLWCRVVTPYSTAVTDQEIIEISSLHPIDLEEKAEKIKKTATKKRTRSYKTSISEKLTDRPTSNRNEINVEASPKEDEISKGSPDIKLRLTDSYRLNSILKATDKVSREEQEEKFILLSKKFEELDLSSSFSDSHEFPLLNSPSNVSAVYHRSTPSKTEKHKLVRMSQKQRKRLSSQSSVHEEYGSPETTPEPRKNPWKIELATSPELSSNDNFNMENIILSEKKEKDNLNKLKSKLLVFTQIEDKAIEELRVFYNADNAVEEVISVERVNIGAVAIPVWVPKTK